jgi:predicted ester cyclase
MMSVEVEKGWKKARDHAANAKAALEHVCSGSGAVPAARHYSPDFVDHVNDLEFYGLDGAQRSVELYTNLVSELAVTVEEQVVEDDRVTSRFVVTGTCYGRRVRFNGITMSRFERGLIVEDWSVVDSLGMLRQLGFFRAVLVGIRALPTLSSAKVR